MKRLLIINGPNLNMLGIREPQIYGYGSMDSILAGLRELYPGITIDYFQSNHEGELIDRIQQAALAPADERTLGIVLNGGAYSHTSLALADAVRSVDLPVVEVHISNTAAREPIRHTSLLTSVCRGVISGFGDSVYRLAVDALLSLRSAVGKCPAIMVTVSDTRCSSGFVAGLLREGASQVRINSAHVEPERFADMVATLRSVDAEIPILMDTKGPEIRTTQLAPGVTSVDVKAGQRFSVTAADGTLTDDETIGLSFCPSGFLHKGDHIFIDDASLDFEVTDIDTETECVTVTAVNDGTLGSRKSVNLPGVDISALPAVTDRDAANLRMAAREHIAMVAHSFVRSADDIAAVRAILDENGPSGVKLFAKIECGAALSRFSEILEAADGILVARGDLGMEITPTLIPALQRRIIDRAHRAGKPVIVATQLLHTMIEHPRPTRAEIADIATATLEGADILLLCGETAAGRYPAEAVATMHRAIRDAGLDPDTILK